MKSDAISALREAVETYEKGKQTKRPIGFNIKMFHPPKLRTLTLNAEPKASVQKTSVGLYQCFIDGKPVPRLHRLHPTALEAWASLARYIVNRFDGNSGAPAVVVRTPLAPNAMGCGVAA